MLGIILYIEILYTGIYLILIKFRYRYILIELTKIFKSTELTLYINKSQYSVESLSIICM